MTLDCGVFKFLRRSVDGKLLIRFQCEISRFHNRPVLRERRLNKSFSEQTMAMEAGLVFYSTKLLLNPDLPRRNRVLTESAIRTRFAKAMLFLGCTVTQLKNNSRTIQCIKTRNNNVISGK